jgi:hypothetical protein
MARLTPKMRRKLGAEGKLNKRGEYMPKDWDYNEWYFGNKWKKMSPESKQFQVDEQNRTNGGIPDNVIHKKWEKIDPITKKRITYVGYGKINSKTGKIEHN